MWNYLKNDSAPSAKSRRVGVSVARRENVSNRFTRVVLKRLYGNGAEFRNKFASVLLLLIYITTGVWH